VLSRPKDPLWNHMKISLLVGAAYFVEAPRDRPLVLAFA